MPGVRTPDERQVVDEYGENGSIDDVLNRAASVYDDDLTVLAECSYAETAMPAVTSITLYQG